MDNYTALDLFAESSVIAADLFSEADESQGGEQPAQEEQKKSTLEMKAFYAKQLANLTDVLTQLYNSIKKINTSRKKFCKELKQGDLETSAVKTFNSTFIGCNTEFLDDKEFELKSIIKGFQKIQKMIPVIDSENKFNKVSENIKKTSEKLNKILEKVSERQLVLITGAVTVLKNEKGYDVDPILEGINEIRKLKKELQDLKTEVNIFDKIWIKVKELYIKFSKKLKEFSNTTKTLVSAAVSAAVYSVIYVRARRQGFVKSAAYNVVAVAKELLNSAGKMTLGQKFFYGMLTVVLVGALGATSYSLYLLVKEKLFNK